MAGPSLERVSDIVGGPNDMGFRTACLLVAGGRSVVLVARDPGTRAASKGELGSLGRAGVDGVAAHSYSVEAVKALVSTTASESLPINHWANAAECFIPKTFRDYVGRDYGGYMDLNRALLFVAQVGAPNTAENRGGSKVAD
jgi:NAD(P)-dependent dehydrogenase (short-subunit alcohol dehydrogenase family)